MPHDNPRPVLRLCFRLGDWIPLLWILSGSHPSNGQRWSSRTRRHANYWALILFKNGEVASSKVGALPKAKLAEWLRAEV